MLSRLYLGEGEERETFKKYFKLYIKKFVNRKNFLIPTIIWDYDVRGLNLKEYYCLFLELTFVNMRRLENGYLNSRADIVFIEKFYKIPLRLQFKIIKNIKQGKFNNIIIFLDKKQNIDKYDSDLIDDMIHLNVKVK